MLGSAQGDVAVCRASEEILAQHCGAQGSGLKAYIRSPNTLSMIKTIAGMFFDLDGPGCK